MAGRFFASSESIFQVINWSIAGLFLFSRFVFVSVSYNLIDYYPDQLEVWATRLWTSTWRRKSSQSWRKSRFQLYTCTQMFSAAKTSPEFLPSDQSTMLFRSTSRNLWKLFTLSTPVCRPDSSWPPLVVSFSPEGKYEVNLFRCLFGILLLIT